MTNGTNEIVGGETPTDAVGILPCRRARPRLERQAPIAISKKQASEFDQFCVGLKGRDRHLIQQQNLSFES
jgi:hypothetical protein